MASFVSVVVRLAGVSSWWCHLPVLQLLLMVSLVGVVSLLDVVDVPPGLPFSMRFITCCVLQGRRRARWSFQRAPSTGHYDLFTHGYVTFASLHMHFFCLLSLLLLTSGSSFMWHQPCQRCKYTTLADIQKRAIKS